MNWKVINCILITALSVSELKSQSCEYLKNKCIEQLKEDIQAIRGLKDLNTKNLESLEKVPKDIKTKLSYKNGLYYIEVEGTLKVYDLNSEFEVVESQPIIVKKERVLEFEGPPGKGRPFTYFPSTFKLGGGVFFGEERNEYSSDFLFMLEFLSFDKILSIYGISFNLGLGVSHIGIGLGYQFYESLYFNNTSLILGYAYNFRETGPAPFIGISLNF